ncbi:ComEC/Rec2 family competence protein [Mucilaginibacter phyllosphaerae]
MSKIHFLNVYEGDCNIIQHDSGHVSVIDVSNADDHIDTEAERAMKASAARQEIRNRNYVPQDKRNYGQKHVADNPIDYLRKWHINSIFRFIVTHPDMDHLDGIRDFFGAFSVTNVWDTNNRKPDVGSGGGYNSEDWQFYKSIRDGRNNDVKRLALYSKDSADFYSADHIHILAPTRQLVDEAVASGNYNDSSYVLLYTPPKSNGDNWKFLFAGDSHDSTWEYILNDPELRAMVTNVDVLFAPHHGRDSARSYNFLKVLTPSLTLLGNASSEHLAYSCYPEIRITNNQAGYIILDIYADHYDVYVKNEQFAIDFRDKRNWSRPIKKNSFDAYFLCRWNA